MNNTKVKTSSGKIHRVQRIRKAKDEYVPFSSEADGKYWCWCGRMVKGELVSEETATTCSICLDVETR